MSKVWREVSNDGVTWVRLNDGAAPGFNRFVRTTVGTSESGEEVVILREIREVTTVSDLGELKAHIDALSPPDRLRLAAQLMEAKRPELAHTIAERVVLELGAALALRRVPPESRGRDRT